MATNRNSIEYNLCCIYIYVYELVCFIIVWCVCAFAAALCMCLLNAYVWVITGAETYVLLLICVNDI